MILQYGRCTNTTAFLIMFVRKVYSSVKPKKNGFDITLHFIKEQVISSTITTSPCNGDPIIVDRKDDLTFDTFANEIVPLRFSNGQIVPGEITKTVVAMSGLQWDVSDYPCLPKTHMYNGTDFPAGSIKRDIFMY